jgi:hypothetical protein
LQIYVSFLPNGHTHIDIDQLFSRISVGIARSGCLTPIDLYRLIGSCYKQTQGDTTQEESTAKVVQLATHVRYQGMAYAIFRGSPLSEAVSSI